MSFYQLFAYKDYVNWFHIYSKLSQNELLNSDFKIQLNLKCFKIFTIRWYRTKKTDIQECRKDKGKPCQNLKAT